MIRHHPTDPTLAAYAAGTLSQALALVAATHLAQCATCRKTLQMLEAAAGVLLDELAPVPLAADALDRLLSRTAGPKPAQPPWPPLLNPDLPAPLNRVPFGRWWPIGRGIRFRPLHLAPTATPDQGPPPRPDSPAWGGLVLAQPGRALPRHGHSGLELTCVLSGAFSDASGIYGAGDISEPAADHDQPPRVEGQQPCVCVLASEGMQLRGLIGWAQRLVRL